MKRNCMSKRILCIVALATFLSSNTVFAENLIKKDETVYVTLDSYGNVEEQIVSDWLHSDQLGVDIEDKSILQDIENLKGDSEPVVEGQKLLWENETGDIYYRGVLDKELPLEIKVKYFLDGKETNAEDLARKSGEVKIKLDIINKEKRNVIVNGENKTIYIPFTTAAVLDLPMDKFKNVKINSGKIISDGNNQIITFVAIPGLKESLDFDKVSEDLDLDVELEEYLEITADVESFEMGPIMITATPDLSLLDELKEATSLDELKDSINELDDASQQLTDGTLELFNGADEFNTKFATLNSGIGQLGTSSKELGDGVEKLAENAKVLSESQTTFNSKFGDFYKGINFFADEVAPLSEGIGQLSDGVKGAQIGANELAQGTTQLGEASATIKASTTKLNEGSIKLDSGVKNLDTGLNQMNTKTKELVAGQNQVDGGIEASLKGVNDLIVALEATDPTNVLLPKLEELKAGLEQTNAGSDLVIDGLNKLQAAEVQATNGSKELVAGSTELSAGLGQLEAGVTEFDKKVGELNTGTQALSQGLNQIVEEGIVPLEKKVPELLKGTSDLQSGTEQLYDASNQLTEGTKQLVNEGTDPLNAAVPELLAGVNELNEGSNALYDASEQISSGAKELADNMKKFNEEGIDTLSDEANDSLDSIQEFLDTKDKMFELSEEYGTFSGLADGEEGKVKFILKTDEISTPEQIAINNDEANTEEDNEGFFHWIKNIFSKNDDESARR